MWTYSGNGQNRALAAYDASGSLAARQDAPRDSFFQPLRSPSGDQILVVGADRITAYSAADGKPQRTYDRRAGGFVASAFSADGHWLALLLSGPPEVQLIDLRAGTSQKMPVGHDPNANLPGLSGQIANVVWGTLVFGQDPDRFYALTDWAGPVRLTTFAVVGGKLEQRATALEGEGGRKFPTCAGPAVAGRVIGEKTLVTFCWFDGTVAFFDLATLTSPGVVKPEMKNPFWLSPIFTPDGQLLYLHQWPAFGDVMQVVDIATRRVVGPLPTPTKLGDPGPFSWLFPVAYAGGTSSTMPISPDGSKLYSATSDGVVVLRVPDLKPIAKLAPGIPTDEVWISGDGRTVYATADGGKKLVVLRDDGSFQKIVPIEGTIGGFVSTERS
jgi:hypothetical protein